MRIRYMSDIHIEFKFDISNFDLMDDEYDILVIAGDVGDSRSNVDTLTYITTRIYPKKLIYVTGNHDYYHSSITMVDNKLIELANITENFIYLNNTTYEVGNYKFIGCTGWQHHIDYNINNYSDMNDWYLIDKHVDNIRNMAIANRNFIIHELSNSNKTNIVITHIPPTKAALDSSSKEVYMKGYYISAYHNDYDDIITKYKPQLWICGHCHDSIDMIHGDTMVVRNTAGYATYSDRKNKNFNINKTIVVKEKK